MDPGTFLIASFDIASPWDIAGTPFMVENSCPDSNTQGDVSHRPGCGQVVQGPNEDDGRRYLNALLDEQLLRAVPGGACPDEDAGGNKVGIPWGRPGTGCTLMFEALVMALVRQMSLKAAAAVLAKCDPRLWHLVDCDGSRRELSEESQADGGDEASGSKKVEYLKLFYNVNGLLDASTEDGNAAQAFAEGLSGQGKAGKLRAYCLSLSKAFFMAVVEALLKTIMNPGRFRAIKDRNDALGKVSVEEAVLCPSQSRAPPLPDSLALAAVGNAKKRGRTSTKDRLMRGIGPQATLRLA